MAGELRVYDGTGISINGTEHADGSMENSIHAVSCNGEPSDNVYTIAAAGIASIWKRFSAADDFTAFRVISDGACQMSVKVDAPTSSTDNTPLGTSVAWLTEKLSCFAPRWFQTMSTLCNVTPGNLVNAAFGGSGTATGVIIEIQIKNTGTDAITVRTRRVP